MSQLNEATKQALRLAAVGALLHNLGKINAKFLDDKINSANNNYLYQHILGLIISHANRASIPGDWQAKYDVVSNSNILTGATSAALKIALQLPAPLHDRTDYTVGDLIEYLGQGEPWYKPDNDKYGIEHIFSGGSRLTHLMNRAHHGASGGEKEDIARAQQSNATDLYLSTPFGFETTAPNINNINALLQKIEPVIQSYLTASSDPFPLTDFIAKLRPLLSQAIADTQRPLNDITVGDIGHTGMAFLLTQAAEWILTNRVIDHTELAEKETNNTLFWRVLTVHADSLRYLEEADSLADLRVRQEQIQNAFQQISQKLEQTVLAVEIYADEQRRLFLFPNLDQTHPTYQDAVQQAIDDLDVDGLRLLAELSKPVTNHPKDKNGNGYIGDQVINQLQTLPPYDFAPNTVKDFWIKQHGQKQTQLCTACNIRPQGHGAETLDAYRYNSRYYREKAEKRRICCICMERRAGVAQDWATNNLNKTVWLDEVADSNGRLALIVGQ